MPPLLNDTTGNSYSMAINAIGQLELSFNASSRCEPLRSVDLDNDNLAYELKVLVNGSIGLFLTPWFYGIQRRVRLQGVSPIFQEYYLQVVGGQLWIFDKGFNLVGPAIGSLLPGDGCYPTPLQPGGTGTPVTMPVQSQGGGTRTAMLPVERIGRFNPGCGHSVQNWDVHRAAVAGQPSAIICCPICLYVQRIMTLDDFHNNFTNPYTVA